MIQGCEYRRTLDIHRLKPGKDGGKYEIGNAFALCPNHHAEVHRGLVVLVKVSDFEVAAEDQGFSNQIEKYGITEAIRLDEEPVLKTGSTVKNRVEGSSPSASA